MYLIFRKFLFKPVKEIVAKRNSEVMAEYDKATKATNEANELKASWEEKMQTADDKADEIIKNAIEKADHRSEVLLYESREKAESIIRKAKAEAERDKLDAQATIKQEIVGVSAAISEKIIGREINMEDHRDLIDSFIDNMGDE
ncbi:MAG: F0F1 ATP synthase subunit B [Clostridia bacterium]|nr:F0F1 ATP synthase subunit B [Clostridia bacterium]